MKKTYFLLLLSLTLNFIAYGKGGDNDDNHNNYPTLVINGVEWAAVNVDDYRTFAARPDMYTKFYQWNRAKAWPAFDEVVAGFPAGPITDTVWTINPCPEGWRLPTADEGLALFEETDNSWANAGKRGNAVVGRFFGPAHAECSLPDNMAGCIFLPAATPCTSAITPVSRPITSLRRSAFRFVA